MEQDEAFVIALYAPPPAADEHSAPFWAGLAQRRIVLQGCVAWHRVVPQ